MHVIKVISIKDLPPARVEKNLQKVGLSLADLPAGAEDLTDTSIINDIVEAIETAYKALGWFLRLLTDLGLHQPLSKADKINRVAKLVKEK